MLFIILKIALGVSRGTEKNAIIQNARSVCQKIYEIIKLCNVIRDAAGVKATDADKVVRKSIKSRMCTCEEKKFTRNEITAMCDQIWSYSSEIELGSSIK